MNNLIFLIILIIAVSLCAGLVLYEIRFRQRWFLQRAQLIDEARSELEENIATRHGADNAREMMANSDPVFYVTIQSAAGRIHAKFTAKHAVDAHRLARILANEYKTTQYLLGRQ